MSDLLDINKLRKTKKDKEDRRIDIYNEILKLCHSKIIRSSKEEQEKCFFQIPEMRIGLPVYNTKNCTAYIILKLRKNGFKVKYINPNILYIDWSKDNHEIEREKKIYSEELPKINDFIPINKSAFEEKKKENTFRDLSSIPSNTNIYDNETLETFNLLNFNLKEKKNNFN